MNFLNYMLFLINNMSYLLLNPYFRIFFLLVLPGKIKIKSLREITYAKLLINSKIEFDSTGFALKVI